MATNINSINTNSILLKQGSFFSKKYNIIINNIEEIIISYAFTRGWPMIRMSIKWKKHSSHMNNNISRFYVYFWQNKQIIGKSWIFEILNRLSEKCDVYLEGWWFFFQKKNRRKWTPVDTWIPEEMRDDGKKELT
ncbi:MAG TPA: hypothetical protein VF399_09165 [bacterium]